MTVLSGKLPIWLYLASKREALGLSLRDVSNRAKALGMPVSHGTVGFAEVVGSDISLRTMKALAAVYGDDPKDYLDMVSEPLPSEPTAVEPNYDALLDADPRLSPEVREALRVLIQNALGPRD